MINYLGIDGSINGSGFTLLNCDDDFNILNITFVGFTKVKKRELHIPGVHILLLDKGYSDLPYHTRGKVIFDMVSKYIDFGSVNFAAIEDYSFGSTGNTFDIAEVIGSLKEEIYVRNIPLKKISPSSIKQFATSKGNADKILMGVHFNKEGLTQLSDLTDFESPKADLVDSYWIAQLIRNEKYYQKHGVFMDNYADVASHKIDAIIGGKTKKKTQPTITIPYVTRLVRSVA